MTIESYDSRVIETRGLETVDFRYAVVGSETPPLFISVDFWKNSFQGGVVHPVLGYPMNYFTNPTAVSEGRSTATIACFDLSSALEGYLGAVQPRQVDMTVTLQPKVTYQYSSSGENNGNLTGIFGEDLLCVDVTDTSRGLAIEKLEVEMLERDRRVAPAAPFFFVHDKITTHSGALLKTKRGLLPSVQESILGLIAENYRARQLNRSPITLEALRYRGELKVLASAVMRKISDSSRDLTLGLTVISLPISRIVVRLPAVEVGVTCERRYIGSFTTNATTIPLVYEVGGDTLTGSKLETTAA